MGTDEPVAKSGRLRSDTAAPTPTQNAVAAGVRFVLQTVVVAVVGWYFTGRIEDALKREQLQISRDELQLSNLTQMRDLLIKLTAANVTREEAERIGGTLAAFGPVAVGPLIAVLQSRGDNGPLGAELALGAIGFSHPSAVCEPLTRVVLSWTGLFSWPTHHQAIRLLGTLRCDSARPALEAYDALLDGGLEVYKGTVSGNPWPDAQAVQSLREELTRTKANLGRGPTITKP